MPQDINELAVLQKYLLGVLDRAEHHAPKVNEVIYPLLGLIVSRTDLNKKFKVMTKDGDMKNVLWVHINGSKYAFSYNHELGTIEMRKDSTQGAVVRSFSNNDSISDLVTFFDSI